MWSMYMQRKKYKLWWLMGFCTLLIFAFSPQAGIMMDIYGLISIFILIGFEVNILGRLKFLKNPEKLMQYNLKGNKQLSKRIHDEQIKRLPASIKRQIIITRIVSIVLTIIALALEVLCCMDLAVSERENSNISVNTFALIKVVDCSKWDTWGMAVTIVGTVMVIITFFMIWKRCDYFRGEMQELLKT